MTISTLQWKREDEKKTWLLRLSSENRNQDGVARTSVLHNTQPINTARVSLFVGSGTIKYRHVSTYQYVSKL
jgi:hypothetical protein